MIKKFGDDNANLLVVSLGWYGFLAIFPLLLVVVTIFGFIGQQSLGSTSFPPSTSSRSSASTSIRPAAAASTAASSASSIGLLGLIYGAQGVTQTAQQAMAEVWDVPEVDADGFGPRLVRSLSGLLIIGVTFLINAFGIHLRHRGGNESMLMRILVIAGLLLLNIGLYYWGFVLLTPKVIERRSLFPGSVAGAVGFTLLITRRDRTDQPPVEERLEHLRHLRHRHRSGRVSAAAGQAQPLRGRAQPGPGPPFVPSGLIGEPTEADRRANEALARQAQRRTDEAIGFRYQPDKGSAAPAAAEEDAPAAGGRQ